jgi:hypothetical protein
MKNLIKICIKLSAFSVILAGAASLGSVAVAAKTCTAPSHASCTITCPAGCGAIYLEPDGPCSTFCSRAPKATRKKPGVSIDVDGVSKDELMKKMPRR